MKPTVSGCGEADEGVGRGPGVRPTIYGIGHERSRHVVAHASACRVATHADAWVVSKSPGQLGKERGSSGNGSMDFPTTLIKAVKGTRDLLPPATEAWNSVEAAARAVFRAYNYHEIRTPILEETQFFARGVGEETRRNRHSRFVRRT
jgi:hypothetical protein